MRSWADRLGVSINTLRTALAMLEQEGFLTVRHGSRIALSRIGRPPRIGIFSESDLLDRHISPYHTELPRALRRILRERGVLSRLYIGTGQISGQAEETADWDLFHDIETSHLDGLLISGLPRPSLGQLIGQKALPAVGDSHMFPFGVAIDWAGFLREACRRLHAQGCSRIAVMGWLDPGILNLTLPILTELGLEFRPKWLKHDFDPNRSGAAWSLVREIWTAYAEKPDGLLVCDDVLFTAAIPALLELKIRVPEQLKVVSHANKDTHPVSPFPVSFGEVDPQDMARRMADMILKRVRHQPVETQHDFSPIRWEPCEKNKITYEHEYLPQPMWSGRTT